MSSGVRFSRRLAWHESENALAVAEARRRARGTDFLDLTETNPTAVGLIEPAQASAIAAALGREPARYAPNPRGAPAARRAIADAYAAAGTPIDPDRVLLTASSSESYAYLWKLLCDPGEVVLVPEPSYPLFEYLAQLEGVATARYHLRHDGGGADGRWDLDLGTVDDGLAGARGRARALVVVSPNNPTGSVLRAGELRALDERAARAQVAICADEVFADYATAPPAGGTGRERRIRTVAAEDTAALTFSLGGLSKSCGLPHLKLGWMVVGGPAALAAEALARLELISDTYLSVAGPVQAALPELLQVGAAIRTAISGRVGRNRRYLEELLRASPGTPLTLLPAQGGWTAILRLPAVLTDEEWALSLLKEADVLVHPGYFFELPAATFVVLSLLPDPAVFEAGVARLTAHVASRS